MKSTFGGKGMLFASLDFMLCIRQGYAITDYGQMVIVFYTGRLRRASTAARN